MPQPQASDRSRLSDTVLAVTDDPERDELAEARGRKLIALVDEHLPLEVGPLALADLWQLVGPALIVRQADSLEALLDLRGRSEADAFVVLRSLYDHAVSFAWLAAAPGEERLGRFVRSDALSRLAMDDDAREVEVEVLESAARARFEAQAAELPRSMPTLLQRAEGADAHWAGRVPSLEDSSTTRSYRGLYAVAYRRQSAIAHASLMGLNSVVIDLPEGRRRVRRGGRDPEMQGPFGLGVILLAFTLFISAQTLGCPDAGAVAAAFE